MVPLKGFRVVNYISSSFPKLAWRKGRDLCLQWQNSSWLRCEARRIVEFLEGSTSSPEDKVIKAGGIGQKSQMQESGGMGSSMGSILSRAVNWWRRASLWSLSGHLTAQNKTRCIATG
jgi:hypothetical protein